MYNIQALNNLPICLTHLSIDVSIIYLSPYLSISSFLLIIKYSIVLELIYALPIQIHF